MKKLFCLPIALTAYCLVFVLNCNAQSLCKKGTWMIGLNPFNYSFSNIQASARYNGNGKFIGGDTLKYSGVNFTLNMGAGYFIKDHICVGVGFGNNQPPPSSNSANLGLLLPTDLFARYYLMKKIRNFSFARQDNMRRYAFFLEAAVDGLYSTYSANYNGHKQNRNTTYSYGGKIGIGFTYMFTKHLAFELISMYSSTMWHNDNPIIISTPNTETSIISQSGFNILFGVQGYF